MRFFLTCIALAACTTLQAGCASQEPTQPVSFVAAEEIAAGDAALPASGYVSSGQPDAAVLGAIAAAGYAGVIDLRMPGESRGFDEAATAEGLGLKYVSLPVGVPDGVSFENAAKLDELLAGFDGPVLLHCGSGNRVGALFALRAKAHGASDEEAIEAGREAGLTRLEDTVRRVMDEGR